MIFCLPWHPPRQSQSENDSAKPLLSRIFGSKSEPALSIKSDQAQADANADIEGRNKEKTDTPDPIASAISTWRNQRDTLWSQLERELHYREGLQMRIKTLVRLQSKLKIHIQKENIDLIDDDGKHRECDNKTLHVLPYYFEGLEEDTSHWTKLPKTPERGLLLRKMLTSSSHMPSRKRRSRQKHSIRNNNNEDGDGKKGNDQGIMRIVKNQSTMAFDSTIQAMCECAISVLNVADNACASYENSLAKLVALVHERENLRQTLRNAGVDVRLFAQE